MSMNKQIMISPHDGLLPGNKKESTTDNTQTKYSQEYCAAQKKPDKNKYMLTDSIAMRNSSENKSIVIESETFDPKLPGAGGGEWGLLSRVMGDRNVQYLNRGDDQMSYLWVKTH